MHSQEWKCARELGRQTLRGTPYHVSLILSRLFSHTCSVVCSPVEAGFPVFLCQLTSLLC